MKKRVNTGFLFCIIILSLSAILLSTKKIYAADNELSIAYQAYKMRSGDIESKNILMKILFSRIAVFNSIREYNEVYNYLFEAALLNPDNIEIDRQYAQLFEITGYFSLAKKYWLKYQFKLAANSPEFNSLTTRISSLPESDLPKITFTRRNIFNVDAIKNGVLFQPQNYQNLISVRPLGDEISAYELGDGPIGSLLVASPGSSGAGRSFLGIGFMHYRSPSEKNITIPIMFSYGITDNLDFSTSLPFKYSRFTSSEKGIGDAYAGAKYTFNSKSPEIAASAGLQFPTGREKVSPTDNGCDIILGMPLAFDYGTFKYNFNFGFSFTDIGRQTRDNVFDIGAAFSKTLTENFGVSLDLLFSDITGNRYSFAFLGIKYQSFNFSIGKQFNSGGINFITTSSYSFEL